MVNLRLTVGLLVAGLIVLFTLQNAEIVELRFLFWKLSMSRALMIFSVFAVGIALGWIFCSWGHHRKFKNDVK